MPTAPNIEHEHSQCTQKEADTHKNAKLAETRVDTINQQCNKRINNAIEYAAASKYYANYRHRDPITRISQIADQTN